MATKTVKGNPMIIAYEENGVSKEREATAEEKVLIVAAQAEAQESKNAELSILAQRDAALAKLTALGLTLDDLKALGF
jgi:hypothetical protein